MSKIIIIAIIILGCIGWVKDVVKLIRCDFQAPYKAEVIYGIGAVTGLGSVVGWVNVQD